jgi:hypothetical protein
MDSQIADLIEGSELLVAAIGNWPDFHDANVLRVKRSGDTLTVVVHVFQMTSEVDERGYFVLTKNHLVTWSRAGPFLVRPARMPSTSPLPRSMAWTTF